MEKYSHIIKNIADNTWAISEFNLVNAFLAAGTERAALIDTGFGIGNISKVVEKLTDKKIEILLTHAHPDHDGGLYYYPDHTYYLHKSDRKMIRDFSPTNEMRRMYIKTRGPVRFPGEGHIEALIKMVPVQERTIDPSLCCDAEDGMEFDLGNRVLKVIHTPGHSDGSVCFLDTKYRILFSGDTVNKSIILRRQPENDLSLVRNYLNTLRKIWKYEADFDKLAIGHDGYLIDKDIIMDYITIAEGLLNKSLQGAYEESGFRKGDVVRYGKAELWYQCDQ